MRKLGILLLILVALLVAGGANAAVPPPDYWVDHADTSWWTSNPSATTFTLSTPEQLAGLAVLVNSGGSGGGGSSFAYKTIKLANDISLTRGDAVERLWTPIGHDDGDTTLKWFAGTFDGGGHTISGLLIRSSSGDVGLFGLSTGTIKNVNVSGSVSGDSNSVVGGIVGRILYHSIGFYDYEGAKVTNCSFSGNVNGDGRSVGGIVGQSDRSNEVAYCSNAADIVVSVENPSYVGGVVGNNYIGNMIDCSNTGDISVTASSGASVGGVAGYHGAIVDEDNKSLNWIINCSNTGKVSVILSGGNSCTGGVVGDNGGLIVNCSNTGAVAETGDIPDTVGSQVGGVVGFNSYHGVVKHSSNTGDVTLTTSAAPVPENNLGGVAGLNWGTVQYSSNGEKVSGNVSDDIGGVVGRNFKNEGRGLGKIDTCEWLTGTAERGVGVDSGDVTNVYVVGSMKPAGVMFVPAYNEIKIGELFSADVKVHPAGTIASKDWTKGGDAYATITIDSPNERFVTFKGYSPGKAWATVRVVSGVLGSPDYSHTANVDVISVVPVPPVPVTGVSLRSPITLSVGKYTSITADIMPTNATKQTVSWKTSDSAIANVIPITGGTTAEIFAVKKGEATITVTTEDGGKTATSTIHVIDVISKDKPILPTDPSISADIKPVENESETDPAAAAEKMPDIKVEDLVKSGDEVIVSKDVAIAAADKVIESNQVITDFQPLPVFTASVDMGKIAAVEFPLKGDKFFETKPEYVKLFKVLSGTSGAFFTYTRTPSAFGDKMFTIQTSDNQYATEISPTETYKLVMFIRDGGSFDLDKKPDTRVIDPTAILKVEEGKKRPSGGGCSATYAPFAILLALPLFFIRKRK